MDRISIRVLKWKLFHLKPASAYRSMLPFYSNIYRRISIEWVTSLPLAIGSDRNACVPTNQPTFDRIRAKCENAVMRNEKAMFIFSVQCVKPTRKLYHIKRNLNYEANTLSLLSFSLFFCVSSCFSHPMDHHRMAWLLFHFYAGYLY